MSGPDPDVLDKGMAERAEYGGAEAHDYVSWLSAFDVSGSDPAVRFRAEAEKGVANGWYDRRG